MSLWPVFFQICNMRAESSDHFPLIWHVSIISTNPRFETHTQARKSLVGLANVSAICKWQPFVKYAALTACNVSLSSARKSFLWIGTLVWGPARDLCCMFFPPLSLFLCKKAKHVLHVQNTKKLTFWRWKIFSYVRSIMQGNSNKALLTTVFRNLSCFLQPPPIFNYLQL